MKLFSKVMMTGASIAAALALTGAAFAATTFTYASNGPENSVRGRAEKLFLDEIEKQNIMWREWNALPAKPRLSSSADSWE